MKRYRIDMILNSNAANVAAKQTAAALRAAGDAADKTAKQTQKAADAHVAAWQKATAKATADQQKQADNLERIQSQWLARDYRARVASERRKQIEAERTAKRQVKAINDEELAKIVSDRRIVASNKARVDAAVHADKVQRTSFADMMGSMESVKGGLAAVGVATAAMNALAQSYANAAAAARAHAAAASEFEANQRETATLTDKTSAQAVPGALRLMMSTGLDQTNANNFVKQFEGSLPIGLQKGNITRKTADDLMVESAKTLARQGGDASTAGDLAGILGQFGKVDSVEQGVGQIEAIRQGLTAGRGDDPQLTKALLNVAGANVRDGGMVGTLPEMAALVGTMSLSAGPGMADTRSEQLIRAVTGSTPQKVAMLQSEFGVKPGDTLEPRLKKIVEKVRTLPAEGSYRADYLTSLGFDSETAKSVTEIEGNYNPFLERMDASRAPGNGQKVLDANQAFSQKNLGMEQRVGAMGTAAEVASGEGARMANLILQAEEAAQKDREKSGLWQAYDMAGTSSILNPISWTGIFGKDARIQGGASERLSKQIFQMQGGKNWWDQNILGGNDSQFDQIGKMGEYIRSRGGDPLEGYTRQMERAVTALERLAPNGAPPPNPPKPQAGPMR